MVHASPDVSNFGQVMAGDLVLARYTEAIAAEVVRLVTGTTSAGATTTMQRADAGKRPGASEAVSMKGVVKVAPIDITQNTADITVFDGTTRRVAGRLRTRGRRSSSVTCAMTKRFR